MIRLFRFFKEHKILFYCVLIISFAFFAYFGSKVKYEEDISKLLPTSNNVEVVDFAFADLKVKDKIFVSFSNTDTLAESDEYELSEACNLFVETLMEIDSADEDIDDVLCELDSYTMMNALAFLFENVPIFIDSSVYNQMDSLFLQDYVSSCMKENYELLSTAEGESNFDIVRHDPINLHKLFLNNGLDNMSGGYKIKNQHFFSSDGKVVFAFLSPKFKSLDSGTGTRLEKKIRKAANIVEESYPDLQVLYHGAPIQSVNNSKRIKKDLLLTMGISVLIISLLIGICFRNKNTLPLLLLPIIYGTFFSLTGIYFIKGSMSLMALGLGAIVLGVALSYCLHVLTHYKYVSDPEQVLREQTKPVIMGCLTTMGAFAGLLFTKSTLLQDFGLFALLAMLGTTIACLVFLPHFFKPEQNQKYERSFRLLERINGYPWEKKKWLLISITIVVLVCILLSNKIEFDHDLKNIGYYDNNVMKSQQLLNDKISNGKKSQFYAVLSEDLDSALIYNQQMANTCKSLQKAGVIANYSKSSLLLLPNQMQQQRINCWEQYFTSSRIEKIKQLIISEGQKVGFDAEMFDPFFESLAAKYKPMSISGVDIFPEGLMSNFIEQTKGKYLVFTSIQMLPENLNYVNDVLTKKPHTLVIDPFFYTGDMVKLLHDDFNTILGISAIFVFVVLLIAFRSFLLAIIAFLPMSLSWYVVLGAMAMLNIPFNLINIIVSTFIFGIGVDYSIFIMDGMLARTKGNNSPLLVYHKTAIFLSAILLIICMASLLFAIHPAISSIGFAALLGMFSTLLLTYSVQPFLFNLLSQTNMGRKIIKKQKRK